MSRQIALALVRDLFFRSKIDAAAAAVGAEVGYASTLDAVASRCAELKPSTVFTDLSDDAFPALETLKQIRAAAPAARVIGFASHVDLKTLQSRPRRRLRTDALAQRIHRPSPRSAAPLMAPPTCAVR